MPAAKGNKYRQQGFGFERRFVTRMKKEGAKRAIRHYGSYGVMDIEWTDALGFKNEAQCKYSRIKLPTVSKAEMDRIKPYAEKKKNQGVKCWIICKVAHGAEVWEAMN